MMPLYVRTVATLNSTKKRRVPNKVKYVGCSLSKPERIFDPVARVKMKVRTAGILGLFSGIFLAAIADLSVTELISIFLPIMTVLAVLSILIGKKILKGPIGGFLIGLEIGIAFGFLNPLNVELG